MQSLFTKDLYAGLRQRLHIAFLVSTTALLAACYNGDTESFIQAFEAAELDIASIEVTASNSVIETGQTQSYQVIANKNDGSTSDITDRVTFSVSNGSVASINSAGLLTGLSAGVANVIARFANFEDTIQVEVSDSALQSIAIEVIDAGFNSSEIPACTYGYQLKATGNYGVADDRDITGLVTWESDAPAIVDIDSASSQLLSFSAGSANVTASRAFPATAAAITSTPFATTSVDNMVADSIEVSRQNNLSNTSMVVTESRQYVAAAAFLINGSVTDPKLDITRTAVWSLDPSGSTVLSDPDIAKGSVTATSAGSVVLEANCVGESGVVAVNVIAAITLSAIRIDNNNEQTEKINKDLSDSDFQLKAFAIFSDSSETEITDDDDITWRLSSGSSVSVSNEDNSEGEVTINSAGVSVVEILYEGLEDDIVIDIED